MKKNLALIILLVLPAAIRGQYWQQQADYTIRAELDTATHLITGTEAIRYHNNSPDTLTQLYFHLYWNAFSTTSSMNRVLILAGKLRPAASGGGGITEDKSGYQLVNTLRVNGTAVTPIMDETILIVPLPKALLPGSITDIQLDFTAKVPACVERAGRKNPAGIDYSCCQWYPKICRYDKRGWHPDPYLGREFAGVFGNFDVTIILDKGYTVAGTGVLQNKSYKEKGYTTLQPDDKNIPAGKTAWHFVASNVHDFAWAADPEYDHKQVESGGVVFHFFYKDVSPYSMHWQAVIDGMETAYATAVKEFGPYRYPQFSFIQAGEGYMEYPMCTFLEKGDYPDFLSTAYHEFMHAWFYGMLGNDENMFHWLDEGLTTYAEARLHNAVRPSHGKNYSEDALENYLGWRSDSPEEPVSTYANYFKSDGPYYLAAYYKGQLFAEQLRYIAGEENVRKGFHLYVNQWCFRHPEPDDFVHCMEKTSGLELNWFYDFWIHTVKTVDMGVRSVTADGPKTTITLDRVGDVPMPADLLVTFADGKKKLYYIPINLMYGAKPHEQDVYPYDREIMPSWKYPLRQYELVIESKKRVVSVSVDPLKYTADINFENNTLKPAK